MRTVSKSLALAALLFAAGGCSVQSAPKETSHFSPETYSNWLRDDPAYLVFPGDKLSIEFRNAPELNREMTVAPDGRITMPLIGSVMVASRSPDHLRRLLERAYSEELIDPSLTVSPVEFTSQQVFVGGEVQSPGVYQLPGQIDPLQAIMMAGGWVDTSKPEQVIILRRGSDGQVMTRIVDVKKGIINPNMSDIGPLKRFDVVYVNRKRIADQNLFVQQFIRNALPIDFSLYYDVLDSNN